MPRKHFNQFKTTVGAPFGFSDASLTLAAGAGAQLGTIDADNPIRLTLARGPLGAETEFEIVEFTGRTGDTLTGATRKVEGNFQDSWLVGERVENRLTAAEIDAITAGAVSESFVSSNIAISNGASGTISHGLSSKPSIVQTWLVCVGAELGYLPGEEVLLQFPFHFDGGNGGFAVSLPNSTDIFYIQHVAVEIATRVLRKSDANGIQITPGNWRLRIKAFA